MDPVAALDELVHFAIHNDTEEVRDQDLEPLLERDGVIQEAAVRLEIPRPRACHEKTLGFTRLPYDDLLSHSRFLDPKPEWLQEMKTLRMRLNKKLDEERSAKKAAINGVSEAVFEVPPEDRHAVKRRNDIIVFARLQFGVLSLSERTVRSWLTDNSLRHRKRGKLLEFSVSDLRALCSDMVEHPDHQKPRETNQVSRNETGTNPE